MLRGGWADELSHERLVQPDPGEPARGGRARHVLRPQQSGSQVSPAQGGESVSDRRRPDQGSTRQQIPTHRCKYERCLALTRATPKYFLVTKRFLSI